MPSIDKLVFAQKYPFSNTSKEVIKQLDLNLQELPEEVKKKAFLRVQNALNKKPHLQEHISNSEELLQQEVLSFPVAKIIVSFLRKQEMEQFCRSLSESTFHYLKKEKNRQQIMLDLADELDLKIDFSSEETFNVKLPVMDFLHGIGFSEKQLSLVNLPLENGFVFLNENQFARLLAQKAYSLTLRSLPVNTEKVPKDLKELAFSVRRSFEAKIEKEIQHSVGRISPSLFPECMQEMYSSLLKGKKLSHMENFSLTTFLNAVGMRSEQILNLYRKQPNFDERISRYQIERIAGVKGKGYYPPTCEKIRSYGLCSNQNCNTKHPLSFYKRNFFALKKEKQKEKPTAKTK